MCLFQAEHRLLISGDHLLGRISLYFDYGYSPDPVGEFVRSLDVVEGLHARLCLPGHGRTFTDVHAHIEGNRALVAERLAAMLAVVGAADEPLTAFEIAAARLRRRLSPPLSPVAADRDAGDAAAPPGHRPGACGSPASPSGGRSSG